MSRNKILRYLTSLTIVFWIILSGVVIVGAYLGIWLYEDKLFETEKSGIAEITFDSLRDAEKSVGAIKALFASNPNIDSDSFRIISQQMLEQVPTMESLRFASIVYPEDQKAFEESIQKINSTYTYPVHQHLPQMGFDITTQYYEPLLPLTANQLGENLVVHPELVLKILDSIEEGSIKIAGPVENDRKEHVFYLISAIYSGKVMPSSPELRKKAAIGTVMAEMNISKVLSAVNLEEGYQLKLFRAADEKHELSSVPILAQDLIGQATRIYFATLTSVQKTVISRMEYHLSLTKKIPWNLEKIAFMSLTVFTLIFLGSLTYLRVRSFVNVQQEIEEQVNIKAKIIEEQKATMINSAKLASLGEMAGGVAHEINSPLMIIRMLAEQLKRELKNETINKPIFLSKVEKIDDTITRIATIISGLLTFSRNADKDKTETVLVTDLINKTLYFCQEKIKREGIDVIVDPIPESLTIDCKEVQLSQVMLNLLNNAHDAVMSLPEKWIRISVEADENTIFLAVTDSGKGISKEIEDKLFQPFMTTKEPGKGTGLGLSISKGIVEKHCGQIKLDRSSLNTKFVLSLPQRSQQPT